MTEKNIYFLVTKQDTLIATTTTRNTETPAPGQVWEMREDINIFSELLLEAYPPPEEKLPVLLCQAAVTH